VERCYALIEYARAEGKLEAFLLSYARAVNAEGIRAETDAGMKQIVSRCGLEWSRARPQLDNEHWRTWAEKNLEALDAEGHWGVPVIEYGSTRFWGQDRFKLLENHIRRCLDC